MTIKTQVLATALLTLALLGAARWSHRIAPLAATVAACVDTARAAAHVEPSLPALAPVSCFDPTLVANGGTR
jgi:hypothetical protein